VSAQAPDGTSQRNEVTDHTTNSEDTSPTERPWAVNRSE